MKLYAEAQSAKQVKDLNGNGSLVVKRVAQDYL